MQGERQMLMEKLQSYPENLANIIYGSNHTRQQMLNVSKTILCWKKMTPCIAREEKSMPAFKTSKHRPTLLLGAHAAGDFNL